MAIREIDECVVHDGIQNGAEFLRPLQNACSATQNSTTTDPFGYNPAGMNLGDALHSQAQWSPQKTALFCSEAQMSYRALDESTTVLAKWFLDQGLQPGDRVAVHWTNSIPAVQLLYALFKAGLTAVTINTRLKTPEIEFILNHAQARMCFSEPALAPLVEQVGGSRCPILTQLPVLETAEAHQVALSPIDPDQMAVVIYTSGTTARPKGVMHTHRSLTQMAIILKREWSAAADRWLCVLPLMHAVALLNVVLSIELGNSLVLLPRFDPVAVLDAIEQFGCSRMVCMPALWQFVVAEQERAPRRVSSLIAAGAGGDAVPVSLQDRFRALFGIPLQEGYGLTESVTVAFNPVEAIRPGSIGLPLEGVELRIVDAEGRDVLVGEVGELIVRSPGTFVGYWNDLEATHAAIKDGWLRTGDLASRDADGYYWFRGRKKEIIIRAGSNISPQEVEEVLYQHPAVLEAGIVGQPDPVYGEIVVAFIVLRDGSQAEANDLRQFAQKRLADYKVPEKFVFLSEMTKGPTGKVHRRALKESLLSASVTAP